MAKRTRDKLTARTVAAAKKPGRYGDGGGLYLVVTPGSRKWVFRFTLHKRQRDMGLGSAREGDVTLATARILAAEAREHLRAGRDPIAERARKLSAGNVPTFGAFADQLVDEIEHGFRNKKHRAQWRMTLQRYAASLRSKQLNQIDTEGVLAVLKPIWRIKPETASRLRGRIERVLDAAKAKGYRTGDNPARWRGHLATLLPRPAKLTRGHHAALPFGDTQEFISKVRKIPGFSARALEFTILTVARTGEVLGARRQEIDFDSKVWVVPAARMKGGREHRVPLSERALEIVRALPEGEPQSFLFPGRKAGKPLSPMALTMVLRRIAIPVTVHGFRSTFRDWAGECTSFPREIVEIALAHVVGDETERAYRRGDALEKRRELMKAWAMYCEPKAANVVTLPRRAG